MHRRHRARRLPAYFCGMTLDLTDKEQLAIAAKPPASELGYRVMGDPGEPRLDDAGASPTTPQVQWANNHKS